MFDIEKEWPPNVVTLDIEGRRYTVRDGEMLITNHRTGGLEIVPPEEVRFLKEKHRARREPHT
jgi:hypothetical protein